jgi:hypothetical protein
LPGERTAVRVMAAGTATIANITTTIQALSRGSSERRDLGSFMGV